MPWQDWAALGRADPIATALPALADTRTERTAGILLDQYDGALERAGEQVLDALSTGDAALAKRRLDTLVTRYELGKHLATCWKVVLAGPPNVGKSSLVNRLVGYGRAIVDSAPGTTRDILTATTAVDGWPVEFADTAGLRAAGQEIERAGMALTEGLMAKADLIVLVSDSSRPFSDDELRLAADHPGAILVHNKSDLPVVADDRRPSGLSTSALDGQGIGDLLRSISSSLVPDPPLPGEAVPFTAAQHEALRAALHALSDGHIDAAVGSLSPITGRKQC